MFARKVAALLKPNSLPEFTNLMEGKILPWLRKQEGFRDLVTLAVPNSREVATISFWDDQKNAEAYHTSAYPEVLEILQRLLDGAPYLKTFEVVSSTFQEDALVQLAETEHLRENVPTALPCVPQDRGHLVPNHPRTASIYPVADHSTTGGDTPTSRRHDPSAPATPTLRRDDSWAV